MPPIEFFFDFRSPYSYLAHSQLPSLGPDVVLTPMDVLAVMKQVGNSPTTILCEAKGRYARVDLRRWASRYQIPFQPHPQMRDLDGRRLSRAALAADRFGQMAPAVAALFSGVWASAAPLGTAEEIAEVLAAAGVDSRSLLPLIDSPELDAELDRASASAADRGVFGAPTFVAEGQMFFGNDRLEFLRQHLETSA